MGRRGEDFVIIQFILFGMILFAPEWSRVDTGAWIKTLGVIFLFLGAVLVVWSFSTLGSNLTPFPRPLESNRLVTRGPYRIVRHPIYTAFITGALGYSLYMQSPLALLITILLAVWFDLKTRREERWLVEKHPEYELYRKRVHKLIPWLY